MSTRIGVPVMTPQVDIANVRIKFASGLRRQRDGEPSSQLVTRPPASSEFFQPDMPRLVD